MKTHDELKAMARKHLKELGYLDEEIFEEYSIAAWNPASKLTLTTDFRVDIVGIKEDGTHSVAFECGHCKPEKLIQLNLFFNEVWQLPYISDRFSQDVKIRELEKQLADEKANRERFISSRISQEKEIIGKIIMKSLRKLDLIPECFRENEWKIGQWRDLEEELEEVKRQSFELTIHLREDEETNR